MNPETRPLSKLYELTAPGKGQAIGRTVVFCKRILVGRSDSCDLVVSDSSVSAIHAVVEVTSAGGRVYDMNSNTGTAVNGKKVVCQDIKLGDKISFGGEEFVFKEYDKAHSLPPVLDALAPEHRGQSAGPLALERPVLPQGVATAKAELPPKSTSSSSSAGGAAHEGGGESAVAYPLARDPKAEFSEYIFEDADHVYPIFKWSVGKSAAEVIILHKDQIFSVDYLPSQKEIHHIKGWRKAEKDVEFPYLGKGESTPFIEVSDGQVSVLDSLGYEGMLIGDENITSDNFREKKIQTPVFLRPQDILKLRNNDLQIFIRNTQAPPKIKHAPMFRRDNEVRKYFAWLSLLCCILLGLFSMVTIDEEREKEKQPERMATILYKKRVFLDKKRRRPKPVKKIPQPVAVKKAKPKPKVTPKPTPVKQASSQKVAQSARKKPVKASSKKAPLKKRVPKKAASRSPLKKQPPRSAKKVVAKQPRRKKLTRTTRSRKFRSNRKSKGHVDTYRPSNKFASSLSSLLAKGGKVSGVKSEQISESNIGVSGAYLGGGVESIKKVSTSHNVARAEDVAVGKLDQNEGTKGLVDKKQVAMAGIPSRTVVLGNYDARLVADILRQHLPQFRYCYQQELDRENKVSGKVELHFNIGASGRVTKAGVAKSALPGAVDGCVIDVLKAIRFPAPMGGGVVAIRQPMYFTPRSK